MTEPAENSLDRRFFLKLAVTGAAAVSMRGVGAQTSPAAQAANSSGPEMIAQLAAYIANSPKAELPKEVIEAAKRHILDSLAAMVSGSKLKPGQLALKYIESQGGKAEAQVAASKLITSAVNAAFANGMMATRMRQMTRTERHWCILGLRSCPPRWPWPKKKAQTVEHFSTAWWQATMWAAELSWRSIPIICCREREPHRELAAALARLQPVLQLQESNVE